MNPPEQDILITEGHTAAKVEAKSAAGMMFLQLFFPENLHAFICIGSLVLIKDDEWNDLIIRLNMSKLVVKRISSKSKS